MDGQKNQGTKPIDQPTEEFIDEQPNRRDQKEHSSDPLRRSEKDTADDRESSLLDDDDEADDLQDDVDDAEREED